MVIVSAGCGSSGETGAAAAPGASDRTLAVTDFFNNRVLLFEPASPLTTGQDASVVIGQSNFTSSGAATTASGLDTPYDVAYDGSGNLWIVDLGNNRVLEFMPPLPNGMNARGVIGQADFTSNIEHLTQSGLDSPTALTFDDAGDLWVSDRGNNRVLEFKPWFSYGMNASRVIGQGNFTSGGSATNQSSFNSPFGLAFDSAGNLWVADEDNNRVLEFMPPFTNGMNASVVIGQTDFTSAGSGTTASTIKEPAGMAFAP